MLYTPATKRALRYCLACHEGQLDKTGLPYALHPVHLAEQMRSEDETCAALLHDVMEDCGKTLDDLRGIGLSERVVEALTCSRTTQRSPTWTTCGACRTTPWRAP